VCNRRNKKKRTTLFKVSLECRGCCYKVKQFNIPVFFSIDALYQNRTAKDRHNELQRAECTKFRKCTYVDYILFIPFR